jgi:hypothetical protein
VVENFSEVLIEREERFCKTAVGLVLRAVSKFDMKFVGDFLGKNDNYVIPEVRRNAEKNFVKRIDKSVKVQSLKQRHNYEAMGFNHK